MQTLKTFAPLTTANQWPAAITAASGLFLLPQQGGPVPLPDGPNDETAPGR